jgi:hypothetical protein
VKCGEPKPGSSYATCDRDLKHHGDHGYLNDRWPRIRPAEPDWDVQSLLEDAIPATAWGVDERSFPIVVTETITRVLWVDAENEDQALAYWDGDVPTLDNTEVLDACLDFERPDRYQRQAALDSARHGRKAGPLVACPDCGAQSLRREWMHNPMRKCHGPIEWRETQSKIPAYRWRRKYRTAPVGGSREQVTA